MDTRYWSTGRIQRHLVVGLLVAGVCGRVQGGEAPAAPPAGPPVRHFIVVENSARMSRLRNAAADVVSKLLLDSFGNRARPGDVVSLSLLSDHVTNNAIEPFLWDPDRRIEVSNRAFRLLKDLDSSAKTTAMTEVFLDVHSELAMFRRLNLYLVTSGADPVVGTPFDSRINGIYSQHAEAMRKARKPFFTVIVAENGRMVAHAVTPGDRPPYIPALPPPPTNPPPLRRAEGPEASERQTNRAAPLILVGTNRPAPLSVEEIARRLREAQEQVDRSSATNESPRAPAPPPSTSSSDTTPPPAAAVAQPLSEPSVAAEASSGQRSPTAALALPMASPPTVGSAPAGSVAPLSNSAVASAVPPAAVVTLPPARPPAPARTPDAADAARRDMTTSLALLGAAACLAWILVRQLWVGRR